MMYFGFYVKERLCDIQFTKVLGIQMAVFFSDFLRTSGKCDNTLKFNIKLFIHIFSSSDLDLKNIVWNVCRSIYWSMKSILT